MAPHVPPDIPFHMLEPQSMGSDRLREFIAKSAMSVWFFEHDSLTRAFELMESYAGRPMDLADASLVASGRRRSAGDAQDIYDRPQRLCSLPSSPRASALSF